MRDVDTWTHSWGTQVIPRCVPEGIGLDRLAMTLSTWRDLESVASFAYRGLHAEALSLRGEWFQRGPWPGIAAWWIDGDHTPGWDEAAERVDLLHTQGPTAAAFTFRQPFDAAGSPVKLDRARIAD